MSPQSQTLESGRYVIYSHLRTRPVGLVSSLGIFKLPIRVTPDHTREVSEVKKVKHPGGVRYLLTVDNHITTGEGDFLWGYDHNIYPEFKGTRWIVEVKDKAGHYAIFDHLGKGWMLEEGENEVTLERVPDIGVPAAQLWFFERIEDEPEEYF
ncbi:hypothetical protein BC827DRAFT_715261 [Russula dissimulans]|nr:hypothetical protein BC827DRAFT_715261 [Russula dissimulans]